MPAEIGNLYIHRESNELYMICEFSIASCMYVAPVNITRGVVGPIWGDPEDFIKDMELELIAPSLEEYEELLKCSQSTKQP